MIPRRPFYFLRHGQTNWNLEGRYQGVADTPLNETGLAQAQAAAAKLASAKIDRIVASPLIRALKTAGIVAEATGAAIHIDRGLRERDFGSFDGRVIGEVKAEHGLPTEKNSRSIMPSDADPWDEIFTRVPPVIGRWLERYGADTILFVAHGGVFDAIHLHLVGPREGAESKHAWPYLVEPTVPGWAFREL
ncbi:MAG: histidine phosphatase family protein [Hyphomicrobiaceae bacterium]